MKKKYIVLKEFADRNNIAKHYNPGDELPGAFGEERLAYIVKMGLAKVENSEAETGKGSESGNPQDAKSTAEKAAEKPRQTVVKAIEERIENLAKE
ncbi:MAG: hypothetical protein LBJ57_02730 [Prevotellaceae bacterium]|jgi:hypothetical protein|nr:hypothetical protein [Prevotellaceae bacterium]